MRKILLVLVCLSLLGLAMPAFAARGDREEMNFGYVNVASSGIDAALVARPCYVYGVTIYPTSTNCSVYLFDNASSAHGTVLIELGEAAQYNSKRYDFDPPVSASNGVYADVTSCGVAVEYR